MQQNFSKFSPTNLNFVREKLLCNTEFKQKVSEFSLPYNGSALKNLRKALRKSDSPLNIELSCISVQNGRQRKGEGWDAS